MQDKFSLLFDPEKRSTPLPLYATYAVQVSGRLSIDPAEPIWFAYRMRPLMLKTIHRPRRKLPITQLCNLEEVAKDLRVPPSHLLRFLVLGLNTRSSNGAGYLLDGYQPAQNVSNLLIHFIVKYVSCTRCCLPELDHDHDISNPKKRVACRACGWKGSLDDFDLDERFKSYLRNAPPSEESKKRGTRSKPRAREKGANEKKDKQELLEEVQAHIESLEVPHSSMVIINYLQNLKERERLESCDLAWLVISALLSHLEAVEDKVKQHRPVLIKFVGMQLETQLVFFRHLEALLREERRWDEGRVSAFLQKTVLRLIKEMYDEDILDEEAILAWYHQTSDGKEKEDKKELIGQELRVHLKPLCIWLEQAEEESSSEDETGGGSAEEKW